MSIIVEILEILLKSQQFAVSFKNPIVINTLMSCSKLEITSSQTRSRIIKLISYLTRGDFHDIYRPKMQ